MRIKTLMYALEEEVLRLPEYFIQCAARETATFGHPLAVLFAKGEPERIIYGHDQFLQLRESMSVRRHNPQPHARIYLDSLRQPQKFVSALVHQSRTEENPIITFNADWKNLKFKVISAADLQKHELFIAWYRRLKEQCKQIRKIDVICNVLNT